MNFLHPIPCILTSVCLCHTYIMEYSAESGRSIGVCSFLICLYTTHLGLCKLRKLWEASRLPFQSSAVCSATPHGISSATLMTKQFICLRIMRIAQDCTQSVLPSPCAMPMALAQGPSPDEVALVEGARKLGFEFLARSRTHISLRMQGHPVRPVPNPPSPGPPPPLLSSRRACAAEPTPWPAELAPFVHIHVMMHFLARL